MELRRCLRHLGTTHRQVRRRFPPSSLHRIEQAIRQAESLHGGEIRVVIEGALPASGLWRGQTARARALELFAQLHVWDTEDNNGVLIYLLLADRAVEIVADRHIHRKTGEAVWQGLAAAMQAEFRRGDFAAGVLAGVEGVARELARHCPQRGDTPNQLPDAPTLI